MTDESGDNPDLLARAATGDQEALRLLFSHYRDRLKRMVHCPIWPMSPRDRPQLEAQRIVRNPTS